MAITLSFASPRNAVLSAIATVAVALVTSSLPIDPNALDWVFVGLWVSVIVTVGLMHLWNRIPAPYAVAAGINAGAWAGMLAALSSLRAQMVYALSILLILFVGHWIVERGYGIALKVVGSWLVAIAILAIFVSLTPTPGYKPDHME
ncbi:MAG: hypothetical protein ABI770_09770 [Sphingomicrobium sp.]